MSKYGESIFSFVYLIFTLIATVIFLINATRNSIFLLFALLSFILGFGDSFHLIPRIIRTINPNTKNLEFYLGLGLFLSSITMTLFYIVLFWIWKILIPNYAYINIFDYIVYISAGLRIILCFFPQNNWFKFEGNRKWGIYRNLPFIVVGIALAYLYCSVGNYLDYHLWQIGIAIIISFLCYIPVILYSKKNPKIGLLMIPKTIAYVWMISIGLILIGKI